MYNEYYPHDILEFYKKQRFFGFLFLNKKRLAEIKEIAEANRANLSSNTSTLGGLMSLSACRLTTSAQKFGLKNSDEIIFFYITIIDPNFNYLEAYECANKKDQIKSLCIANFGIYDPYIIYYEVLFQRRFHFPELTDLWARGEINCDILFNEHGVAK